jgi:nitrate/nitrite transport system ATP-binding protein
MNAAVTTNHDPPLLAVNNVAKSFPARKGRMEVLSGVNLEVSRGEFVAIVGFSGSGKSTLISLLAGLNVPDSGTIEFDGRPVRGPGRERGIVFQNYSLLPWLTVAGNVRLAVDQVYPDWSSERKSRHVDQMIANVNLSAARDKRPAELSGGMRQRVAVARALAMDPEVLLLDEPLGALDALTRATLQDEIGRLHMEEAKTVVLITNDVDEAILLADRIIPLSAGPRACLGPQFEVHIARPRDRKGLNHCPEFKQLRNRVTNWLLTVGRQPSAVQAERNAVERRMAEPLQTCLAGSAS